VLTEVQPQVEDIAFSHISLVNK